METQRVSIIQASIEIGCTPQTIREKMYTGQWDLGKFYKSKSKAQKARYYIFRPKLDRFLGKEVQA